MIAFVISLLLIVVIGILGKYTKLLTVSQTRFALISSVLYIIFFGITMSMLTSNKSLFDVFTENSVYIPLIFYMLWYITSSSIVNRLTGNNDYQGFFGDSSKYMSQRDVR